uniref:Transcription factor IIIC subunit 5 HTH domain-containing protein n=1 Tax=Arion vulgaris TaxID=1028688 RepID=A0A0B6YA37_9EUPU
MDNNFEQSNSFSSDSSPLKKNNTDRLSDEEDIDEIVGMTEHESEIGVNDGDNVDDSKDFDEDVDEDIDDEDNEAATADISTSHKDKSQPVSDAFDAFEFVRQGANMPDSNSVIEEEIVPEANDWLDGDKLYTAHINRSRHFVCIDYPGVIQNQDKALATLGGMEGLSKTIYEGLKLELSFRPNDPYCKPTIGSFTNTKNLLLKIRRRRKVVQDEPQDSSYKGDGFEYQIEVIGTVDKMYIFDKLCDFQYLPVTKEANGKYKDILSIIRPNIKDDRTEYFSRNVPIFLPPISFSRRELPAPYNFETEAGDHIDSVVGIDRKKRFHGTIHISFGHPDVPRDPDPVAFERLTKLPNQDDGLNALKQLFEQRPLWSKVGIFGHLDKIHHTYLKYLLPVVSYYYLNGPWKNLWCKFGPDALRASQYGLKQQWSTTLIHQIDTAEDLQSGATTPMDLTYIFNPDHIPPYRQMRYQVCDVHHDEVQNWLHKNDGQETTCTERDGWCVPDFTDVCRDIISGAVEKLFSK